MDKTQQIDLEHNPKKFIQFYDSVNKFLLSVPDTVETKISIRAIFLRKMKYIGIYDEAINQTFLIFNERSLANLNDSVSYALLYLGEVSGIYSILNMPDSFLYYKRLAIEVSRKHTDPLFQTGPLNNMGMHWLNLNELDSAYHYFLLSEKILNDGQPLIEYWENFRHSVTDNIATCYEETGEYQKTKSIYEENYYFYDPSRKFNRKINAGISLANAFIETNKYEEAYRWLIKMEIEQKAKVPSVQYSNTLYLNKSWVKYYTRINDYKNALKHELIVFELIQNSMTIEKTRNSKYSWQRTQYARERLNQKRKAELAIKKQEEQNQKLRLWIFVFIGIGILFIILTIWTKLRNEKKFEVQKSKQLLQEKKLLNLELEFKKKDLVDVTLNVSQKREWAQGIQDRLKRIQNSKGNKRSSEFKQLNNHVRNQILMEKELNLFNENINTLNAEYYAKLKTKFPDLTKSETQLCSFIKLNLTNAQISQLKNIDPNSVIVMRYRLKKKLHLNADHNLDVFVRNF